jgi:hypothetical protein
MKATPTMVAALVSLGLVVGALRNADCAREKASEASPSESAQLETRRMALEENKFLLEKAKFAAEAGENRRKDRFTVISTTIPIVITTLTILSTVFYGIWSLRQNAKTEFEGKIAEVALNSATPYEAIFKARFLAAILKKELPSDFAARLTAIEPGEFGIAASRSKEAKTTLLQLLAEHPAQRTQVLKDWVALFPDDKWVTPLT